MYFRLKAQMIERFEPQGIEADTMKEAKTKLLEMIEKGEILPKGEQVSEIQVERECSGCFHGHRWDFSIHEDLFFCKYCGITESDYR